MEPSTLNEALTLWRALSEKQRANTLVILETATSMCMEHDAALDLLRAAAEPEAKACVFCKHVEPHTKREGKCDHLKLGCTAPGCDCDAYEAYP